MKESNKLRSFVKEIVEKAIKEGLKKSSAELEKQIAELEKEMLETKLQSTTQKE